MLIKTIKTGATLVSSAVPDRSSRRFSFAYTGLFQKRSKRINVPVKCFYVKAGKHSFLIDTGWSKDVVSQPLKHLGFGLWFASEPVMKEEEAAVNQLKSSKIEAIMMTHLDCDHASGLKDFSGIPVYVSADEIDYARHNKVRYGKLANGHDYRELTFQNDTAAPFGKSIDVFSDGYLTAYLTPTHSKGSVIYKIAEDGHFALVVGDNGYTENSWKKGILPGPLYDSQNTRKCLAWIDEQSKDNNCIGIYCAHDPIDR